MSHSNYKLITSQEFQKRWHTSPSFIKPAVDATDFTVPCTVHVFGPGTEITANWCPLIRLQASSDNSLSASCGLQSRQLSI
jgi:hypothetical protein